MLPSVDNVANFLELIIWQHFYWMKLRLELKHLTIMEVSRSGHAILNTPRAWELGFEAHWSHGVVSVVFYMFLLSCLFRSHAMGRSPVEGVPKMPNDFHIWKNIKCSICFVY
jgi:hypothetical protein